MPIPGLSSFVPVPPFPMCEESPRSVWPPPHLEGIHHYRHPGRPVGSLSSYPPCVLYPYWPLMPPGLGRLCWCSLGLALWVYQREWETVEAKVRAEALPSPSSKTFSPWYCLRTVGWKGGNGGSASRNVWVWSRGIVTRNYGCVTLCHALSGSAQLAQTGSQSARV